MSTNQSGYRVRAQSFIAALTSTVSSATDIQLNADSPFVQVITGTANQTLLLPNTSTLIVGQQFKIINKSSYILGITIQTSTAVSLGTIGANASKLFTCLSTSANTPADWDTLG